MAAAKTDLHVTIYNSAESCETLLDRLLTLLSTTGEGHRQEAQQLRSSFERWAGFLGVFADPHVCLDKRLESSPQIYDRVIRLLKVVERNAEHAVGFESTRKQILQRENANPPSKAGAGRKLDVVSLSISPATGAALRGIQEALAALHRIGVAVRKTSSSSLTFRVGRFAEEAKKEFDFYERIDLLIVNGLYPGIPPSLSKQLAESVSFRRARLRFQRSRQRTLETRRVPPTSQQQSTEAPRGDAPTPQAKNLSSGLAEGKSHGGETRSAVSSSHDMWTETDLTPVNTDLYHQSLATEEGPAKEATPAGPLTVSGIGYSNPYPRLPSDAQCNWCFQDHNISKDEDGWKQAWKNHFKRDLEPYVCISEDCGSNLQYFASLSAWQHHMNNRHTLDWIEEVHRPAIWFCEASGHDYQDFATESELREHLQEMHPGKFGPEQQDSLVSRNVLHVSRPRGTCPLCGTDVAQLAGNEPDAKATPADPSPPAEQPEPVAKPSSPKKGAKRLRFADPINSDDEDGDVATATSSTIEEASGSGTPAVEHQVQWRTDQIRLSTHIAGHLKSLAFVSLRYFDDKKDDSSSQGSGQAASGDPQEKLSSESVDGDHYFELDPLDQTSFKDLPLHQRLTTAGEELSSEDPAGLVPPDCPLMDDLSDLGDRIDNALVPSKWTQPPQMFMPEGWLDDILTVDALRQELKLKHSELEFALERAKKVVAILLLCDFRGDDLSRATARFLANDFTDRNLPIPEPTTREWDDAKAFGRDLWSRIRLARFYEVQWRFLAPIFQRDNFNIYDFDSHTILPFVSWHSVDQTAYSQLYMVQIHPAHTHPHGPFTVVIKQLIEPVEYGKSWMLEMANMATLAKNPHPHIIRCFGGFYLGTQRCLLLEWADGGNLQQFWDREPSPTFEPDLVLELIAQCRGLADALAHLHAQNCRHGDLKPANILRFSDANSIIGVLKIADFGVAKTHAEDTALRQSPTANRVTTLQYEPPEIMNLDMPRSRAGDIWSIGCVFFELLLWLLYGTEAVHGLSSRINDLGAGGRGGSFYEIDPQNDRPASLNPSVVRWLNHLEYGDPECTSSSVARDFLSLIRHHLLVVEVDRRMDAKELYTRLCDITEMARTDPSYLVTGLSRDKILHPAFLPRPREAGSRVTSSAFTGMIRAEGERDESVV